MKIGFIGLGAMGAPMAQNLIAARHEVALWNRTRAKAEAVAAGKAQVAATPAEATRSAAAVVTMLADDAALAEVMYAPGGVREALAPDAVHVSMSTISVEFSRGLAGVHRERGQHYVAAPVFGRPEAAAARRLTIIAAGAAAALARCQPIFDAVGHRTFVVGEEPGRANLVKLSGNFMIAAMLETLSEAFALVRKSGIDPEQWLDIMTETLFPAPIYKSYGSLMARRQFSPPGFRLVLGLKDVQLVLAAAGEQTVPMPLASLVRDSALAAVAAGLGDQDWAALARVAEARAGISDSSA